jgi:ribosomal-protein-alanine N-acetyltransferase
MSSKIAPAARAGDSPLQFWSGVSRNGATPKSSLAEGATEILFNPLTVQHLSGNLWGWPAGPVIAVPGDCPMIELQVPAWWEEVPVLTGPTVELREVAFSDVSTLLDLLGDPQVTQYISAPPPTLADFHGFILWAHRQREAGSAVCLAVVPKGLQHAIGLFQVRALEPGFKTAEWGFALGAAFWSTGIFLEAATLVADFAFSTIRVHRLEARAVVENARGNRALEKVGACGEALLRNSFNRKHSQFMWSLFAEEWQRPRLAERTAFDAARLRREIAGHVARYARTLADTHRRAATAELFPFFLTESRSKPEEPSSR